MSRPWQRGSDSCRRTSEINYESKRGRKRGLGKVGNGSDVGLFVHPVLAVDAETGHCLGLADVQVWRRFKKKAADYRKQPIEDKESYRWLKGPRRAKWGLAKAAMITVIDDREGGYLRKMGALAGPSHPPVEPRLPGPFRGRRRKPVRGYGSIPGAASLRA